MNRRDFLRSTGIVSTGLAFAKVGRVFATDTTVDHWRTFDVTTRVEVLKTSGITRIWLPAALISRIALSENALYIPSTRKAARRKRSKIIRMHSESSSQNFRPV